MKGLFVKTTRPPADEPDEEAPPRRPLPVSPLSHDGPEEQWRDEEQPNNQRSPSKKKKSKGTSPRSPDSIQTAPTVDTDVSSNSTHNNNKNKDNKNNEQVVRIEHTVKPKNNTMQKLKKPLIGLLVVLLFGTTALLSFKWLEIPGLNEQIQRLEAQVQNLTLQVDRLEEQVDRLGGEVDRLEEENDRLEENIAQLKENLDNYEDQNKQLNDTLQEYEEIINDLNETVHEFREQNEELQEQLDNFEDLNDDLNSTAQELAKQVDRLEDVVEDLQEANEILNEIIDQLSNETDALSDLNADLSETVQQLNQTVAELSNQVDRLQKLNDHLETLVSFFDETATDMKETYEEFAAYLAEQITAYRKLVMQTLENIFIQRLTMWDCDFRSYFLAEPFTQDRRQPIGSEAYPKVLDYVEERVLSELCLSTRDFELYVQAQFGVPSNLTVTQLTTAVAVYSSNALEYYFPDGGDSGLNTTVWAESGYDCSKLSSDHRYRHV